MSTDLTPEETPAPVAPVEPQPLVYVYRNLTLAEFNEHVRTGGTAFKQGRWLNYPTIGDVIDVAVHYTDWNKDRPFKVSGRVLLDHKPDELVNEAGELTGTEEVPEPAPLAEEEAPSEVQADAGAGEDPAATPTDPAATPEGEGGAAGGDGNAAPV